MESAIEIPSRVEPWALANEYPATSLPGKGDAHFARLVTDRTRGKLAIVAMPDARPGYPSREQLRAVADGRVAMADMFSGALGEEEAILGLSTLPFVVESLGAARSLCAAARPAYEAAFARHNQTLLFSTPWPASGLWSRTPADSVEEIASFRIRAYDETGARLFARLGSRASVVSFSELGAKVAVGQIDAVLSSGDGGAGRALWEHLPRFTAINYAMPLSFTTVNLDRWKALDAATRGEVEVAARETEAHQWRAIEGRLAENYARMREHAMTLVTRVSPALRQRLREAGREAVQDWKDRAGGAGAALLENALERR